MSHLPFWFLEPRSAVRFLERLSPLAGSPWYPSIRLERVSSWPQQVCR